MFLLRIWYYIKTKLILPLNLLHWSCYCYGFFQEFSPDALLKRAGGLLQKLSYLDDLYSLGQTENWAMGKLKEHIPLLCEWARKFVAPFPHSDFGAMDFKTPEYPQEAEQPNVCVSALKDIEENIWSPRFGLKGQQHFFLFGILNYQTSVRNHEYKFRFLWKCVHDTSLAAMFLCSMTHPCYKSSNTTYSIFRKSVSSFVNL